MEIENFIPDPDEFSYHRNEMEEKYRRSSFSSRLMRGHSVQDPSTDFMFPALSCRRRSVEKILGVLPRPVASTASREAIPVMNEDDESELLDDSMESEEPVMQTRRATISAGNSNKNPYYKKRPNSLRDWPFGEAKVKNDEDFFELELNIGLFAPEEVSAKVMGKELIIHCKPNPNLQRVKDAIPRELFRCYPLPLSSPPLVSDVSIVKDDHWIRIAVRKESALKSPIGLYSPEIAEILEEEHRSDVEEDDSEQEVRMDD